MLGWIAAALVMILTGALAHAVGRFLRVPAIVVMSFWAVLVALLIVLTRDQPGAAQLHAAVSAMPPAADLMMYALLPVLLFQAAMMIDMRQLARDGVAVVLLAIVAVMLSVAIIGGLLHLVTGINLLVCLLVGSIVATTDPAAVISIFRSLGAPPRLVRLIEGESLLNDATAIAIFTGILGAIVLGRELSLEDMALRIGLGFGLGALFGAMVGWLGAYCIGAFKETPVLQTALLVSLPFGVFVLAELVPIASPVIAVVVAGMVVGTIGRTRFSTEMNTWFGRLLEALSEWASAIIVGLAALSIPYVVTSFGWVDLWVICIVAFAALLARAVVLWGMAPVLSWMGLMEPLEGGMRVAVFWGGLRGAMTLALALLVGEQGLSADLNRFVLVAAMGYALMSLLLQGTTLRPLLRFLHLDVLPSQAAALRSQVLRETLVRTREATVQFAVETGLTHPAGWDGVAAVEEGFERAMDTHAYEVLPEKEKLVLGLTALVAYERQLVLHQRDDLGVGVSVIDTYCAALDKASEAVRLEGRAGYASVFKEVLQPSRIGGFWIAVYNRFGVAAPLERYVAHRYQWYVVLRGALNQQQGYIQARLMPVLGERIASILAEMVQRRQDDVNERLDLLAMQFPDYAAHLEEAILVRFGLQEERRQVDQLEREGVIDDRIARSLREESVRLSRAMRAARKIDIKAPRPALLKGLPSFANVPEAGLKRLARAMRSVFLRPGVEIMRPGESVAFIYFIAQGVVEVEREGVVTRLGPGQAFGQVRILNPTAAPATVRTITACHCYKLPVGVFRTFVREMPDWGNALRSPKS